MKYYYLPFHIIPGLVMMYLQLVSIDGLTVQVSEHGRDVQSCLHGSIPCKTLTYALCLIETAKITNVPYASVTVNVTSNQTINTHNTYYFSSSSVSKITVVGYNHSSLYFQESSSLEIIMRNSSNSGLTWTWVDLGFVQISATFPKCVACDICGSVLTHVGVDGNTLNVLQCKFISIGWNITDIQNIIINGSVFGTTGLCPGVCIHNTGKSDDEGVVKISNNSFHNCSFPSFKHYLPVSPNFVLAIFNKRFTSTEIFSNKFSAILSNSQSLQFSRSAISIRGNPTAIVLKKNVFVGNSLAFVDIKVHVTNVSIQSNTFCHNRNITPLLQHHEAVAELSIIDIVFGSRSIYNNPSEISVLYNDFKSNTNSLINILVQLNHMSNQTLSIIITDLVAVNNSAISEVITVKNTDYLKQNICMEMKLLQVENNNAHIKAELSEIISMETSIINLVNINELLLVDSTFKNNLGTSLLADFEQYQGKHLELCVLGNVVFQQNSGYLGGALALHNVIFIITCRGSLQFQKNYGVYGGALYLDNIDAGIISPQMINLCRLSFYFVNNSARTAGNSIYYAFASAWELKIGCIILRAHINKTSIRTDAKYLSFQNYSTVFPGQTIFLNGTILDFFGNPSSCLASVSILCNTGINCHDFPIKLSGPDKALLTSESTTKQSINTNMVVQSPKYPNLTETFSLLLVCENAKFANAKMSITVTSCPNGFHYNTNTMVCQCAKIKVDKNMVCSMKFGVACIAHGYWYGELVVNDYNFTDYTIARCAFLECKYSNVVPCPPEMQSDSGFVMLNYENNSQCSYGRGGVLCRSCDQNFVFSFLSINCISEQSCHSWQPYLIMFSGIIFQVLIAILLLLVIRFKHALGSGFLYGPMLFLAVVSHLPLDNYSEYSVLSDAVSVTTSIALLNLKLFGRIPWCFFPIPKMYNYSLHFLGPLTVLVVLVGITIFAQRCPSNSHCLRKSCPAMQCWKAPPLKAVCILMLLSFWSLADTSINILTPTVFEFREFPPLYMVSIQPDIKYFSPQHLPVAIPALLVLLGLILPLVIILILSPILQRMISLHRIMPFLDEFQSCYEDRYRWYSGVYFVVWIIIVGIQGLPDFMLYTQTIFIILLCAQFLIKPYKSKLLNVTDTLLLVDINFLISLVYKLSYSSPLSHGHIFSNLLIHALVIVPFVCAIVSVTCMFAIKSGVYNFIRTCLMRRPHSVHLQPTHLQDGQQQPSDNVTVQEVCIQYDHDSVAEREPLIAMVNDN